MADTGNNIKTQGIVWRNEDFIPDVLAGIDYYRNLNESDYDQAMQNLAKKADITLSKPEGRNKFRTEKEFTVGYTWRNGEEIENEIVTVKANTEEEALAKAKEDAPRLARVNGKFKIIK